MQFKTRAITVNGDVYRLRELSAGAIEAVDESDSEFTQALVMLALSLCADDGEPLYGVDQTANALGFVRGLPVSLVRDHLIPAATELNTETLDDARGN